MKKFLIVAMLFALSGCTLFQNELERAMSNLDTAESYRMDITFSGIPFFGTITMVELVDGDYCKSSNSLSFLGSSETISFEKDEKKYEIVDYNNEKIAIISDEEDSDGLSAEPSDFEQFDPKDFSKGDDGYYASEDNYDDIIDLKIKIENDNISEMSFRMEAEGMTIDVPEFRYLNELETAVYRLEQQGYIHTTKRGFHTFTKSGTTIEYSIVNKVFSLSNWSSQKATIDAKTESGLSETAFDQKSFSDYLEYDAYLELMKVSEHATLN